MKSSVIIKGVTLVAALSVLGRGASARWLSPDPLWHTLGKEALERPFEAANPYTYAGNNPINATDPSGLCPWCLVGLGAAALLFIQNDVDANIAPAIALTPPGALAVGTGMFADATDQIGQLDRQRAALLAAGNTGPASEARLAALDAGIREAGAQAFFGLATVRLGSGSSAIAGRRPGVVGSTAKAGEQGWKLGGFKSAVKWESQMVKRGWTPEQITEAMQKGEQFASENLVNKGNASTRYVHPETGRSVVIDDVTKEVIHVGAEGFKY